MEIFLPRLRFLIILTNSGASASSIGRILRISLRVNSRTSPSLVVNGFFSYRVRSQLFGFMKLSPDMIANFYNPYQHGRIFIILLLFYFM